MAALDLFLIESTRSVTSQGKTKSKPNTHTQKQTKHMSAHFYSFVFMEINRDSRKQG